MVPGNNINEDSQHQVKGDEVVTRPSNVDRGQFGPVAGLQTRRKRDVSAESSDESFESEFEIDRDLPRMDSDAVNV